MRTLTFILIITILYSCEEKIAERYYSDRNGNLPNHVSARIQKETEDFETELKERKIKETTEVVVVDDCEYIILSTYSNYPKPLAIVHKGNCNNLIHQRQTEQ